MLGFMSRQPLPALPYHLHPWRRQPNRAEGVERFCPTHLIDGLTQYGVQYIIWV